MTNVRMKEKFNKEVAPTLMKDLSLDNLMEVPRIEKIVVNAGIGSFRDNKEAVESFIEELAALTGQAPSVRKARLSIAGFKIRKGDVVGVAVTLRGARMWAFLDKFINVVLPQVRDFKGVEPDSFDESGNYSVGITEHTVFPEVNPNTTKGMRHMQITIVTTADEKEKAKKLLEALGMPFREDQKKENG